MNESIHRRASACVVVAALALLVPLTSKAELGKSPADRGGFYVSGAVGYGLSDGLDVAGHSTPIFVSPAIRVESDTGALAGLSLGYVLQESRLGFEGERLEISVRQNDLGKEEETDAFGAFTAHSGSGANGGAPSTSRHEREVYDFSLAYKADGSRSALTHVFGLEAFARYSNDEIRSLNPLGTNAFGAVPFRDADVDAWFYGAMLRAEPEYQLRDAVSLVGSVGLGGYGFRGDADFRDNIIFAAGPANRSSDSETGVGFRWSVGLGLKYRVLPSTTATIFANTGYWSDVPHAELVRGTGVSARPSRLETEGLSEVEFGARVTVSFGSGGASH